MQYSIFLNGIFESVLNEILEFQTKVPEQTFYLQPYSSRIIRKLSEHPPSSAEPIDLFISNESDLSTVRYKAKIIGWEKKKKIRKSRIEALNKLIQIVQPQEVDIYKVINGKDCANLLQIKELEIIDNPFTVEHFTKIKDGTPVKSGRATAGGWTYINPFTLA
jgi:5-methylcytosine-specific restriction enzyme A